MVAIAWKIRPRHDGPRRIRHRWRGREADRPRGLDDRVVRSIRPDRHGPRRNGGRACFFALGGQRGLSVGIRWPLAAREPLSGAGRYCGTSPHPEPAAARQLQRAVFVGLSSPQLRKEYSKQPRLTRIQTKTRDGVARALIAKKKTRPQATNLFLPSMNRPARRKISSATERRDRRGYPAGRAAPRCAWAVRPDCPSAPR